MKQQLLVLLLLLLSLIQLPLQCHGFQHAIAPPLTRRRRASLYQRQQYQHQRRQHYSRIHASPVSLDTPDDQSSSSTSSNLAATTLNLIKACVGSGVLALPSGLAIMSDSPKAVIPACILLIAIGGLSAYTFYTLGKLCHESDTNPQSLGDLWQDLIGPSWIVDATTVIMCYGVCLTYSMVLGDFTAALLLQRYSRNACILGVTATCLYPLARLPSLDALAPMSMAGVGGVVVTCAGMVYRSRNLVVDATMPLPPLFDAMGTSSNPLSALVLMSMAATAYLCHFSAPDFLASVQNNLRDYRRVTALGFASVGLMNVAILAAGFLTFGGNCAGVILNSYAPTDVLASVCRFLMVLSVVGSYPFCLGGAKTALYNLFGASTASDDSLPSKTKFVTPRLNHFVTVAMLAAITIPSLILKNAGLVVSFNGATMGSAITYIFPSMLVLAKLKNTATASKTKLFNRMILAFGWTAAIAGGTCSILSAYAPQLLR